MNLPNPTKPGVFWVVDGNHPFSDALTWMDQMMGNLTVKVYSVNGFVQTCARHCIDESLQIEFLAVFGHGTGGYQGIGAGKPYDWTGNKSLGFKGVFAPGASPLNGQAEKTIAGLNGLLTDQATIFLGGCNVGDGDRGSGLLTTVSNILGGRRVQAFEWAVYWWLGVMVGPLKEAKGDSVSSSFSTYSI